MVSLMDIAMGEYMAEERELTGWERSRAAQKGYGNFYAGLAIATVFIAGVWIGSRVFATPTDPNSSGFFLNLWTEALGILVTVGLFGLISQWLAENRYKRQLVDEVASTSNEIAKHAVHVLKRRGWLEGADGLLSEENLSGARLDDASLKRANLKRTNLGHGSFKNADFFSADLEEAYLTNADLTEAKLICANLSRAILQRAKLTNAKLDQANLRSSSLLSADLSDAVISGASLQYANLDNCTLERADFEYAILSNSTLDRCKLQNANLHNADLEEASLIRADLRGADLSGANLLNAQFSAKPNFDDLTIMPNSSNWTPTTEIERFTNSTHSKFWRSADPDSPAFCENT